MKTNRYTILLLLFAAVWIQSCSKVEEPYLTYKNVLIDTTAHRSVLLEDYTGMRCPNCPPATLIGEGLQDLYKGQVFMIQVHAGFYADTSKTPGSIWKTDYKSQAGTRWYTDFKCPQNPMGLINRANFDSKFWIGSDQWADAVAYQAGLTKPAILSISNKVVTSGEDAQLTTRVQGKFLHKLSGSYNVCVLILEDSLISPQQDGATIDTNHLFMNLLRGSMNGDYGELVISHPDSLSLFTSPSYTMTLNRKWKVKNLSVLAFLMNPVTYEVVQVAKKPLIQH